MSSTRFRGPFRSTVSACFAVDDSTDCWLIREPRRQTRLAHSRDHRNGTWCYSPLKVSEDGIIDCWGGLDIELFRAKLRAVWLQANAPRGAPFSVFHLGLAEVKDFEPARTQPLPVSRRGGLAR